MKAEAEKLIYLKQLAFALPARRPIHEIASKDAIDLLVIYLPY